MLILMAADFEDSFPYDQVNGVIGTEMALVMSLLVFKVIHVPASMVIQLLIDLDA